MTSNSGCPFQAGHSALDSADPGLGPVYKRRLGLFHNPAVRREIAALDAQKDCQRIVYLLGKYEFPFDLMHANELALFHTYGSRSVSRLLDKTHEFRDHGQKRYDDTTLLISLFVEAGWGAGLGGRSIAQINKIHSYFDIPNEDYLFVLWTFIDFPIVWLKAFGWRSMTAHEAQAWFNFWHQIGTQMGMTDIPATKAAFDAFAAHYEQREMVFDEANQRVADSTLAVFAALLPTPLRGLVAPIAYCLVRPQLLPAIGAKRPAKWLQRGIYGALTLRVKVTRVFAFDPYPALLKDVILRSYPGNIYTIEDLGPSYAHRASGVQPRGKGAAFK
jgi:hypothetical protein